MLRKSVQDKYSQMRELLVEVYTPSQMKENGNDAAHSSQVASAVPTMPELLFIFGCCAFTSPFIILITCILLIKARCVCVNLC